MPTRDRGANNTSSSSFDPTVKLPAMIEADLQEKQERAIECLRYFHGCYPLAKTGARERASRLHAVLLEHEADLGRIKQSLPKDKPKIAMVAIARINALLGMVHAAKHLHETSARPTGA